MYTIDVQITIVTETCCNCGVIFGMTNDKKQELIESGREFFCPNGHSQHYTRKENLEKKLAEAESQIKGLKSDAAWWRTEAEAKAASLSATRGQLTKMKKRIAGGACPCCHRQFVDLRRHMGNKHPDFAESA